MGAEQPSGSALVERTPFFYGWLVLAAATLTIMATLPGQTVGVSVFLDGIIEDLDTNRSIVSSLYTVATLTGSLVLPFMGRFLDRRGPRLGVAVIGIGFSLACLFMSTVNGLVALAIGFVGIRALGQGSLGLVSQYTVNQWFVRRRGFALGVSAVGFSLGIAVVPRWFTALSDSLGWRGAYQVLAAGVLLIALVAGVGVFRRRPEDYGLEPDGGAGPTDRVPQDEPEVTAAAARRTSAFWLFALGTAVVSALSTGLQFHHFSIMAEAGIARTDAATVFVAFGLSAAAFTLLTGPIVDRIPHRFVLATAHVLLASLLWSAPVLAGGPDLLLYGMALGAMQGMTAVVGASVFAHLFGRRYLGEIRGTAFTIGIAASALGPLPFALGFDLAGSYSGVLRASMIFPIAIVAAALLSRAGSGSAPLDGDRQGSTAAADPSEHGE